MSSVMHATTCPTVRSDPTEAGRPCALTPHRSCIPSQPCATTTSRHTCSTGIARMLPHTHASRLEGGTAANAVAHTEEIVPACTPAQPSSPSGGHPHVEWWPSSRRVVAILTSSGGRPRVEWWPSSRVRCSRQRQVNQPRQRGCASSKAAPQQAAPPASLNLTQRGCAEAVQSRRSPCGSAL